MKKHLRKAFAALAAALICFAGAAPAFADYGYTVRIFAGNQGSIDGQNVKVLEDLEDQKFQERFLFLTRSTSSPL